MFATCYVQDENNCNFRSPDSNNFYFVYLSLCLLENSLNHLGLDNPSKEANGKMSMGWLLKLMATDM